MIETEQERLLRLQALQQLSQVLIHARTLAWPESLHTGPHLWTDGECLQCLRAHLMKLEAQVAATRAALPRTAPASKVRYLNEEPTEPQRQHCRASALYRLGDCVLVWVNEGDILSLGTNVQPVRAHD